MSLRRQRSLAAIHHAGALTLSNLTPSPYTIAANRLCEDPQLLPPGWLVVSCRYQDDRFELRLHYQDVNRNVALDPNVVAQVGNNGEIVFARLVPDVDAYGFAVVTLQPDRSLEFRAQLDTINEQLGRERWLTDGERVQQVLDALTARLQGPQVGQVLTEVTAIDTRTAELRFANGTVLHIPVKLLLAEN